MASWMAMASAHSCRHLQVSSRLVLSCLYNSVYLYCLLKHGSWILVGKRGVFLGGKPSHPNTRPPGSGQRSFRV